VLAAELGTEFRPGRPVPHHGGDEGVHGANGRRGRGRSRGETVGPVLRQVERHEMLVAAQDAQEVDLELPESGRLLRVLSDFAANLLWDLVF